MGRKSKQAGSGHLPLTNYERQLYGKPYGTITKRLNSTSQYTFGTDALTLQPAINSPIATPTLGYIYEKSSILQYLLVKTQQLKVQQQQYNIQLSKYNIAKQQQQQQKQQQQITNFENLQTKQIITTNNNNKKRKRNITNNNNTKNDNDNDESNPLKRTSYWLADFQPQVKDAKIAKAKKANNNDNDNDNDIDDANELLLEEPPIEPPKRPVSPNSQQPLRRKDFIPLQLQRHDKPPYQVLCAISHKAIVTQPALALIPKKQKSKNKKKNNKKKNKKDIDDNNDNNNNDENNETTNDNDNNNNNDNNDNEIPAQVVLESVYNDLNLKGNEKFICPITGVKLSKILKLQQGGSSFASSSSSSNNNNNDDNDRKVEASIYRPTMT